MPDAPSGHPPAPHAETQPEDAQAEDAERANAQGLISRHEITRRLFRRFQKALARGTRARSYLEERGLRREALEVGHNTGRWTERAGTDELEAAARAGLAFKRGERYEAWAPRSVIFPMRNERGGVVSLYGLRIDRPGEYYQAGRQGLYPGYPPPETRRLVLTATVLDAAALGQASPDAARLALYGPDGWTAEHGQALRQLSHLSEVTLAVPEAHRAALGRRLLDLCPHVRISFRPLPGERPLWEAAKAGQLASWLDRAPQPLASSAASLHSCPPLPGSGAPSPGEARTPFPPITARAARKRPAEAALRAAGYGTSYEETSDEASAEEKPAEEKPECAPGARVAEEGDAPPRGDPDVEPPRLEVADPREIRYREGDLHISLPGGLDLSAPGQMRVSLRIECLRTECTRTECTRTERAGRLFWDRQDLYRASAREGLAQAAARTLGLRAELLRGVLSRLTAALESYRLRVLRAAEPAPLPPFSGAGRQAARAFLEAPDLMERTSRLIAESGVSAGAQARLLIFLAAVSRLRERPLHVVCRAEEEQEAVRLLRHMAYLTPEEARLDLSSLSGQALYYAEEDALSHRLCTAPVSGVMAALPALGALAARQQIEKLVPLRGPGGQLSTVRVASEGPLALALGAGASAPAHLLGGEALGVALAPCETADSPRYEQLCSAGELAGQAEARQQLSDAQRALRPVRVRVPQAESLSLPPMMGSSSQAMRLYLSLIEAVAFYHQRQRPGGRGEGPPVIEATLGDVAWANRLIAPSLALRGDALSAPARHFLSALRAYLQARTTHQFRQGRVRRALRLAPSTIGRYLRELRRCGLIEIAGGSRHRGYTYALSGRIQEKSGTEAGSLEAGSLEADGLESGEEVAAIQAHLAATLERLRDREAAQSDPLPT